ncbi:unnamed protein product, partial [Effrenium voratum]
GLGQPYLASSAGWTAAQLRMATLIKVNGRVAKPSDNSARVEGMRARSSSQLDLDGLPKVTLQRHYEFMGDGMVCEISLVFTALRPLSKLQVWLDAEAAHGSLRKTRG